MSKLTLISTPICPFVQRAIITLREKGIAHDVIYIDLADKPDWFLQISPLGKVPVLKVERDDMAPAYIFESSVIAEYLDETAVGRKLHPADPLERAQHRAWMEFASQALGDHAKMVTATTEADLSVATAGLWAKFERLNGVVADPFFSGEDFSLVDAAFAPLFRQLDVLEPFTDGKLLHSLSNVDAWRKALSGRPSVIGAVPENYRDLYLKRMQAFDSLLGLSLRI